MRDVSWMVVFIDWFDNSLNEFVFYLYGMEFYVIVIF